MNCFTVWEEKEKKIENRDILVQKIDDKFMIRKKFLGGLTGKKK